MDLKITGDDQFVYNDPMRHQTNTLLTETRNTLHQWLSLVIGGIMLFFCFFNLFIIDQPNVGLVNGVFGVAPPHSFFIPSPPPATPHRAAHARPPPGRPARPPGPRRQASFGPVPRRPASSRPQSIQDSIRSTLRLAANRVARVLDVDELQPDSFLLRLVVVELRTFSIDTVPHPC